MYDFILSKFFFDLPNSYQLNSKFSSIRFSVRKAFVWGIWYPISNKASVKVRFPIKMKEIQQKEYYRKTTPVK